MVDHRPDDFCQRRVYHAVAGGLKNCISARCCLRSCIARATPSGHAVTDEVRAWDSKVIEQRRHIVGEVFGDDFAIDVGRAPMALHFDGNHASRFGKLADPPGPVVGDGHERAVEQHDRFAAAVDFVVHFESVHRGVASRWLWLCRCGGWQKHRQAERCCQRVWCHSILTTMAFTLLGRRALLCVLFELVQDAIGRVGQVVKLAQLFDAAIRQIRAAIRKGGVFQQ